MLFSTHHILNNFLTGFSYRITAEDTPGFEPEIQPLYDQTIENVSRQIEALIGIRSIDETSIRESVMP